MVFYNLTGHRRCSAAESYTASLLALIKIFRVLIETNVNISNELNFSDVYRNVNYTGSLAKFT